MTGLARVRHLLRGPKPAATNSQSECGMPQSPRARTAPSGAAAPPRRRSILKGPGRVALVAARVAFVAMAGFSAAYLTGAPGESTALRGAQTPVGDARALSEVPVTQTYADLTGHAGDASVVAEGERGWVAAARRRLSTASCDYTEDELSTPFVIIYTVVLLYALLGLAIGASAPRAAPRPAPRRLTAAPLTFGAAQCATTSSWRHLSASRRFST